MWSSESISLKCQFNVNENSKDQQVKHHYKCFSVSGDGKSLIAGSRFNYLHVWSIEKGQLDKTIKLGDPNLTVKDCSMLPGFSYDNKLLIVLCQEDQLDVYNIESGLVVANLNSRNIVCNQNLILNEQKFNQVYCASNGRFLCATTQDGCIQCFDLDASPLRNMKVV